MVVNFKKYCFKSAFFFFLSLIYSFVHAQDPTASFTVSDFTVCEKSLVTFTNTSTGTAPLTYCWQVNNGPCFTIKDFAFTFVTSGNYTVGLTVTNASGVTDTQNVVIRVFKSPQANFSFTPSIGCKNLQVCFTDLTIPGEATLESWQWIYGDGGFDIIQSPCYYYKKPGTFDVFFTVVDTNGCASKDTAFDITVYDLPTANFTPAPTISCNIPATVQFTDNSQQADTNGVPFTNWAWNFGNSQTSTNQNPNTTYNTSGIYNINLTVTDSHGCQSTKTQSVVVDSFRIKFTPSVSAGCTPYCVTFTGNYYSVLGANGKPSVWQWTFAGGNPATYVTGNLTTPCVMFTTPGYHVVKVTGTNAYNCQWVFTDSIRVFPLPQIIFSADTTASCQAPFTVTFTDNTGGAINWEWDFNNRYPNPPPDYDWSSDTAGNPVNHTYDDTGCYNVSVIVTDTNGCIDSLVKDNFICVQEPIADFTMDTLCGCAPFMVGFEDKSYMPPILPDNDIVTWHWDFGDGFFIEGGDSTMPDTTNNCLTNCTYSNPTHTYADTGLYDSIMLIVVTKLGCRDTVYSSTTADCNPSAPFCSSYCGVGVGIPPRVNFYADDTVGCFPHYVAFTNLSSSYLTGWHWDFGDGGTDDINKDPTYQYANEPGVFTVTLISDMWLCADTFIKKDYITVIAPKADFTLASDVFSEPTYAFCYGDSEITGGWKVTFKDTSIHADYWLWDYGDQFDSASFESIDTSFILVQDTLLVPADTIIYPPDTISFFAPDPADPLCNNFYVIYLDTDTQLIVADTTLPNIPLDTIIIIADTIFKGCDTIIITADTIIGYIDTVFTNGDTMMWVGMCDSQITHVGDTVILEGTLIYTPRDSIVTDTFIIYLPRDTIITPQNILNYGCDLQITIPADTIITALDTVYSTWEQDTVCMPHDSLLVIVNTEIIPCKYTFTFPDTLDKKADTLIIPNPSKLYIWDGGVIIDSFIMTHTAIPETFTLNVPDSICKILDSATVVDGDIMAINFTYVDTYGVFLECTPEQITTNTDPPDTVLPDTLWHNCRYMVTDTILPVTTTDTTPADCMYHPREFTHTYSQAGTYEVTLFTRTGLTECVDSTTRNLDICHVMPEFSISPNDSGCRPQYITFHDNTDKVRHFGCDNAQQNIHLWDFGGGCIVPYNAADSANPIDQMWILLCGNTINGTYGNITKAYQTAGSYPVTFHAGSVYAPNSYVCEDSITKTVVIHDLPFPKFTADTLTGCTGLEVEFTDTFYKNQPNEIVRWVWTYANTGGSPYYIEKDTTYTPCTSHIFNIKKPCVDSFNVTLEVMDEFGCKGTLTKEDTISVTKPQAVLNFDDSQCDDIQMSFDGTSCAAGPITYYWDFCDGITDTTLVPANYHTYYVDTTDTFNVSLVISDINGCLSDTTKQVVIHDPRAYFYLDSIYGAFCPPFIAYFMDTSRTTDVITNTIWDFGDNSTVNIPNQQNPVTHAYIDQGIYDVSIIVITSNGCKDTLKLDSLITVSGPKNISVLDTTRLCNPYPMTKTLYITNVNVKWIAVDWGDGTFDTIIQSDFDTVTVILVHNYTNPGNYQPYLTIWDPLNPPPIPLDCGFITLSPVVILGPVINFVTTDTVCGPRTVNFNNTSTLADSIDSWEWNFGNPGSGNLNTAYTFNASHHYANTGVYDVTLTGYSITGQDTCISTTTKFKYVSVFIFPYPSSEGCPPLEVTFTADTITNWIPLSTATMTWDFGDSTSATGDSVTHIYLGNGDSIASTWYNVTATFDNGCSFTWDSLIEVYPVPAAGFIIDPLVVGNSISSFIFINNSHGDTVNQRYDWNFGDGVSEVYPYPNKEVKHAYVDSGKYFVRLIVTDINTGCMDTVIKPVVISIFVPNVFTPNGDGVNEYFNLGIPEGMLHLKLIIFNRWGIKIWESEDYPSDCSDDSPRKEECWDGTDLHGKPVPNDTYFYVLNLEDKAVYNGWVMVLRPK